MKRFNLIDETWIPVRLQTGGRLELGIRDVLQRSPEIVAIEDPSPLVVAALHRFLLALLYRAFMGPRDIEEAKRWFTEGWPADSIDRYLDERHERFWLFHERYPFGQIPTFDPKAWRAWTVLAAEHNADNAKVLFDHVDVQAAGRVSEAAAVRWLLATQTFSVSSGKSELAHTGTAPSATAVMVLPLGRNLRDTLSFCLIPQHRDVFPADLALWEREPESVERLRQGYERIPAGLADRYSWRTRSTRFADDGRGVSRVAFASGVGMLSTEQIDPMVAYRINDKKGKLPIQFRDRGLWRDFDSLLPDPEHRGPQVIEHATVLGRWDRRRFPAAVMVLGQANSKAKIEYWRMELFALPQALAGDRFVRSEIHELLADADDTYQSLLRACRTFARHVLARGARAPDGKDVTGFVKQMPCAAWYWSALESHFHEVLRGYAIHSEVDEIRRTWLGGVRVALHQAWAQHTAAIGLSEAWTIRALVKAESAIRRELAELKDELLKLETQDKAA